MLLEALAPASSVRHRGARNDAATTAPAPATPAAVPPPPPIFQDISQMAYRPPTSGLATYRPVYERPSTLPPREPMWWENRTAQAGLGIASVVAMGASYARNKSILLALAHGVVGVPYLAYRGFQAISEKN